MTTDLARERCQSCTGLTEPIPVAEVDALSGRISAEWQLTVDGRALRREVIFKGFAEAMAFLNDVARAADEEDHHPDFTLRAWNRVELVQFTYVVGGLTRNDFVIAAKIDEILARYPSHRSPDREEGKAVVRKFVAQVLNSGDLAALRRIVSPQLIEHETATTTSDRESLARKLVERHTAFPDLRFDEVELVAEVDLVALRGTWRGTHRARYIGTEPTQRSVEVGEHHVFRVAGGSIVEHWSEFDAEGLMRQLGLRSESRASGTTV